LGGTVTARRVRTVLISLAAGAVLAYGVTFLVLWAQLEKRFVFSPRSEIEFTPEQTGLEYEEIFFATQDGLNLHGWFVPAAGNHGSADRQTWVWFHGNGGNIGHRVEELTLLHQRLNVNLFIFDYRGYGRSQGSPSEKGTYLDARAALQYLVERPGVDADQIVYFGRSLGAAVAVELAVARPPKGMVLVSPFSSVREMARMAVPFPAAGLLVRNHYPTIFRIRNVEAPVLVLHGDLDETIPIAQGRKLFEAANEPKTFRELTGAAHNDTYIAAPEAFFGALEQFRADLS
jgi:fermentation-respiration switch protein FrsA (DUF1100 family)